MKTDATPDGTPEGQVTYGENASRFGWDRLSTHTKIIIFVLVFGLIGSGLLLVSRGLTSYNLVWSDEFNGTSLDTSKWQVITGTESHSQAHYTTNDVYEGNGYVTLRTQRHCVSSSSDALTATNASTAPCPAGTTTEYSSGQIQTGHNWKAGRIEVRAKLPSTELGLWPAIWLRNNAAWCTANYGELDVMEWYGDYPTTDTATSHETCASDTTKHVQHAYTTASDTSSTWHTWAVNWDANSIQYELDGLPVLAKTGDADKTTDTAGDFGLTSTQFNTIMNDSWLLRMNTQVTNPGDAWHKAPDNTQSFMPAYYQIDYVRVYDKSTTDVDTTKPTISLTSPAANATVSGTVHAAATASDNIGVTRVDFAVDGAVKQSGSGTTYDWASSGVANGSHTLTATAYDAAGNNSSASVTINVSNSSDTSAPTAPASLHITSISNNDITMAWTGSTDNVAVDHYRVTRDGGYDAGTTKSTSFEDKTVNTSLCTTYCHTYIVYAVDAAGNQSLASNKAVGQDTSTPTVGFSVPTNGTTVSGSLPIQASAADNLWVTKVEFYVDGALKTTTTTTPYCLAGISGTACTGWNVDGLGSGAHLLEAKAYDAAGNVGSAGVSVTVGTTSVDTAPPSLSVKAPGNGSTVSGKISVSSSATDNVGVTWMETKIDGSTYASGITDSLNFTWNVASKYVKKGAHTITYTAKDAAGNIATKSITVYK